MLVPMPIEPAGAVRLTFDPSEILFVRQEVSNEVTLPPPNPELSCMYVNWLVFQSCEEPIRILPPIALVVTETLSPRLMAELAVRHETALPHAPPSMLPDPILTIIPPVLSFIFEASPRPVMSFSAFTITDPLAVMTVPVPRFSVNSGADVLHAVALLKPKPAACETYLSMAANMAVSNQQAT